MRVGLYQIDGKWPNLALMKLSAFHKSQGDEVEFYWPLFDKLYDRVYASKVFQDSSFNPQVSQYIDGRWQVGGYGVSDIKLPGEVEHIYPDYGLYDINFAIGFTSRGCMRHCPFCIVPEKEGRFRPVADIYEFWHGQARLCLLDNSLNTNGEHFARILGQLIAVNRRRSKERVAVDFSQGLDLRLLTSEQAQLLSKVKLWKQIHFAWDRIQDEKAILGGLEIIKKSPLSLSKVMVYVLIGYDTTEAEDLYRVAKLAGQGVDPFIMPFNRLDPYQRRLARWVNHKAIFKSVSWGEYGKPVCRSTGKQVRSSMGQLKLEA